MTAIPLPVLLLLSILINFIVVCLSYLLVARKRCTLRRIPETAGVVVLVCAFIAVAELFIEQIMPGLFFVMGAVLTYRQGRQMMHLSCRQALASTGIYFGINIILGGLLFLLLHDLA